MNLGKERLQSTDTTRVLKRDNSPVAVVLKKVQVLPVFSKVIDQCNKEGFKVTMDETSDWDKLALKSPRLWLDKKLFSEALFDIIKNADKKSNGDKPVSISMKYDGINECTITISYFLRKSEHRHAYGRSGNFSHRTGEIILQHGAKLDQKEINDLVRVYILF